MRHVSYWEADDGTIFYDEDECNCYELTCLARELDGVKALGSKLEEVPIWETDLHYFLRVDDMSAIGKYCDLCLADLGYSGTTKNLTEPGFYYWDNRTDEWVNIEAEQYRLAGIIERLKD